MVTCQTRGLDRVVLRRDGTHLVGSAKTAQKHKLLTDAFKLIYAARFLPREARRVLVVADPKTGWLRLFERTASRSKWWISPPRLLRLCGGRKSDFLDSFSIGTVQQVLWYRMSAYMR